MAKKTKYHDIRIKVECPNCKQISEIQLQNARIRWFDKNNSGFCSECKRYTSQMGMFKRSEKNGAKGRLICSICGKTTICSHAYELRIKRVIKRGEMASFVCPTCGLAERAKNPQITKKVSVVTNSKTKRKDKTTINLFGCRVWPVGNQDSFIASRCKWAKDCEHYDDCVSYIVRNHFNWYGFESDGKGFKQKEII